MSPVDPARIKSGPFYTTDMRSLTSYPQLAGDLFETVQQSGTFSDSKTFADAVPDRELAEIRERFDLK